MFTSCRPLSPFVGHNFKYFNEGDGVTATLKTDVNGATLSFETAGTGNKYVLLCPGALGSARLDFSQQLDNLNKDIFTVIGWDPRGTSQTASLSLLEWSAQLCVHLAAPLRLPVCLCWNGQSNSVFTLQHLSDCHFYHQTGQSDTVFTLQRISDRPFSLLGWSDGGMTAMMIAANYPERVHKLVIWGANAFVTEEDIAIYEQLRDITTGVRGCGRIECPTLIIEGGHDAILPEFHPEHLSEHIKNSKLVRVPEGKHNLHMQMYQKFNSIVEKFLIE
ncbi:hypothetical protein NP493_22g03003 [Ridgeia piscesae]|uniref:AB hydrolase-1 domain-containing protein n=1 Tax=Ridgeia piscesae TaxID=27915 RepID=A0AAD9PDG1_RIDPI|nr:hypothetical protein NP493_22g03003 [Ridgeia piscesae]